MSGRERMAAWLAAAGAAALLAGCATRPPPAPAPVVRQAPQPAPSPPPPEPSRQDSPDPPLTVGDWSYEGDAGGSSAVFGPAGAPLFSLSCDNARRQVSLSIQGAQLPLRVGTSFGQRLLPAGTMLAASDPLLDEIVFSRGRFTVGAEGRAALILPTWPEPARVVEDCRG